jgi:hypothetical protein
MVMNLTYNMLIRPTLTRSQQDGRQKPTKISLFSYNRDYKHNPTAATEVLLRLPPLHMTVEAESQAGNTEFCVTNSYLLQGFCSHPMSMTSPSA